jgi:3-oxoadipate enol-lactonase
MASAPGTAFATASDKYLVAGDVRLRYREVGRGEPVVLLHGLTRSLEDWVMIADSLAVTHRVITLDQRGHGRSSTFTDPARFGIQLADDVIRLLDELHIPRAHLVGHSMGADVVANVTSRWPARVATASIIAPPIYADSAAYMQANGRWVADVQRGAGISQFIKWLFPGTSDADAASGSAAILAKIPAPSFAALHGSISALMVPASRASAVRGVPTLVVGGTGDPLLPQARWLASWWPGAKFLEVAGANHGSIVGSPEVWVAIRGLQRTRTAAASTGRRP